MTKQNDKVWIQQGSFGKVVVGYGDSNPEWVNRPELYVKNAAYLKLQEKLAEKEKMLDECFKVLEFYGDEKVNYYMRNESRDENGKLDGFVNWTDREVDRGERARELLTKLRERKGD